MKEDSILRQLYYNVAAEYVHDWEQTFWTSRENKFAGFITESAQKDIGDILARKLIFIFSATIKELYKSELKETNPMLAAFPDLATEKIKQQATFNVERKLKENRHLIFKNSSLLRDAMETIVRNHSNAVVEFLSRIEKDKKEIGELIGANTTITKITGIKCSGPDYHNNGRKSCIVSTNQGPFAYKPRSVLSDIVLKELVDRMFPETVIIPNAIDKGEYGYEEYIETKIADNPSNSKQFFQNIGGTFAMLHMLGASDYHYENILANCTRPVLVDIETILTPIRKSEGYIDDVLYSLTFQDVLPASVDNIQLSPLLNRGMYSLLPVINGKHQYILDYWQDFESGFRDAYNKCIENSIEIEEIIKKFNICKIRYIRVITESYMKTIQLAYSSKALASPELFEMILHSIPIDYEGLSSEDESTLNSVEAANLRYEDVPCFTAYGNSTDLYCEDKLIASNFFDHSAIDNALIRLHRMSKSECDYELKLIKQSLESAVILKIAKDDAVSIIETDQDLNSSVKKALKSVISYEKLSEIKTDNIEICCKREADLIFEEIKSRELTGISGESLWFGNDNPNNIFTPLDNSLITGTAGLALFAAAYYNTTDNIEALDVCEKTFSNIRRFAKQLSETHRIPASFDYNGILKSSLLIGDYLHNEEYIELALTLFDMLKYLPEDIELPIDYYSGFAGVITTICTDERFASCKDYQKTIRDLADRILSYKTLENKFGKPGWDTCDKKRIISGLGHGQIGIGLALAIAGRETGESKYLVAAEDAFEIEHNLYSDKFGTWPDYRETAFPTGAMHGMCSGAPGIGMAYLKLKELNFGDFDIDFTKAVSACINHNMMYVDYSCCGNCASIEFLMDAGRSIDNPKLIKNADQRLMAMINTREDRGAYSLMHPDHLNRTSVSLFGGLAGIGYTMLRRINPGIKSYFVSLDDKNVTDLF